MKISLNPNIDVLKEQIEEKSKFGKLFPVIKNMSQEKIDEFLKNQKVKV